ncbi:MAG TPA: amidase family protein, partial [Egibacteraceae bacterium]|nr:amidase family protein [Egibacteraceae bacterium]
MTAALQRRSVRALLDDYRAGRTTPAEVLARTRERFLAGDPAIWISVAGQDALDRRAAQLSAVPDGPSLLPLYGIPVAVKDNIDVAGMVTTAACPSFAYRAAHSATAVRLLEAAGAVVVGKTNLDQFATGLVGTRSPYGVPRNPAAPAHIPGGSSSGSAVAVASGQVPLALG